MARIFGFCRSNRSSDPAFVRTCLRDAAPVPSRLYHCLRDILKPHRTGSVEYAVKTCIFSLQKERPVNLQQLVVKRGDIWDHYTLSLLLHRNVFRLLDTPDCINREERTAFVLAAQQQRIDLMRVMWRAEERHLGTAEADAAVLEALLDQLCLSFQASLDCDCQQMQAFLFECLLHLWPLLQLSGGLLYCRGRKAAQQWQERGSAALPPRLAAGFRGGVAPLADDTAALGIVRSAAQHHAAGPWGTEARMGALGPLGLEGGCGEAAESAGGQAWEVSGSECDWSGHSGEEEMWRGGGGARNQLQSPAQRPLGGWGCVGVKQQLPAGEAEDQAYADGATMEGNASGGDGCPMHAELRRELRRLATESCAEMVGTCTHSASRAASRHSSARELHDDASSRSGGMGSGPLSMGPTDDPNSLGRQSSAMDICCGTAGGKAALEAAGDVLPWVERFDSAGPFLAGGGELSQLDGMDAVQDSRRPSRSSVLAEDPRQSSMAGHRGWPEAGRAMEEGGFEDVWMGGPSVVTQRGAFGLPLPPIRTRPKPTQPVLSGVYSSKDIHAQSGLGALLHAMQSQTAALRTVHDTTAQQVGCAMGELLEEAVRVLGSVPQN